MNGSESKTIESNQVGVGHVAEVLGVPVNQVYMVACNQPVYIQSRLFALVVECIVQSVDGFLVGVIRFNVEGTPTQLPVYFSPESRVWLIHQKALQVHPELFAKVEWGANAEG